MQINIKLIGLCLSNNRNAQKQLYDILLPYLNVICLRYLRNSSELSDVLQESFISIFKNLHQYDPGKASFKTWATKVTINNCLKNNDKRKQRATEELVISLHDPKVAPEAIKNISNKELLAWFKKMPESYYAVFNLYVIDGFSHQEISELLKIEESLSRKRLSRSRAWLKEKLPDDYQTMFRISYR